MSSNGNGNLPPYPAEGTGPARRGPASGTVVAIALGVVALLAGGFFGIRTATDDPGASDPAGAVRNLIDAAGSEDVLGLMAALAPGERDAFRDGVEDVAGELERLGILAGNFDLGHVSGLELTFDQVDLETERLADGVARVTIEGGRVRASVFPDQLPLGSFFDDAEDVFGSDPRDEEPTDQTQPLADGAPVPIMTVERDGGWYVSLWYTVAELARERAGAPEPDYGGGIEPRGAASPEEALEELLRAAADLDVERAFALLPPGEADALHVYAPLFLDDVEEELGGVDADIEVSAVEASADGDGGEARVTLDRLAASGTVEEVTFDVALSGGDLALDAEYPDGDVHVETAGDCVRVSGVEEGERIDEEVCAEDLGFGFLGADALAGPSGALTAVRIDGSWYLSPTRTVFDVAVGFLEQLEQGDLRRLLSGELTG